MTTPDPTTPDLMARLKDSLRRAREQSQQTTPDPAVSELGQHYGTASHPQCGPPTGHTCQQPSGRTCYELGCTQPAGTHWGPMWCPDCDARRLDRIDTQFALLRREHGHV